MRPPRPSESSASSDSGAAAEVLTFSTDSFASLGDSTFFALFFAAAFGAFSSGAA
ncbi:MAG: hypothetical protein NTX60_06945 [Actinobacteria bacterium]|nr:hypothetical protein [Actinomycetota bacterium]